MLLRRTEDHQIHQTKSVLVWRVQDITCCGHHASRLERIFAKQNELICTVAMFVASSRRDSASCNKITRKSAHHAVRYFASQSCIPSLACSFIPPNGLIFHLSAAWVQVVLRVRGPTALAPCKLCLESGPTQVEPAQASPPLAQLRKTQWASATGSSL